MELWNLEIIFGLTLTDILNIVMGIIIVAGILYSLFWKRKDAEVI